MSSTKQTPGRFGNHFIRNIVMHIIAEKHDLKVDYSYDAAIRSLGIPLFSGSKVFQEDRIINNDNMAAELLRDEQFAINRNLLIQGDIYCQTKEITNRVYSFLRSKKIQEKVCLFNPFQPRYGNNKDVFIHIRLGDVIQYNPGLEYYNKVMASLSNKGYDRIYISSDTPNHPICQSIYNEYPNVSFIQTDEIQTIQYASTCRYVILSHGSFSAIIGYLAFFSEIYYPEYDKDKIWYGDMFSVPGFRMVKHLT